MLDIGHALAFLRRRQVPAEDACSVCGRRLGETRLAVHGIRVHPECAGYRMRTAARVERHRRGALSSGD